MIHFITHCNSLYVHLHLNTHTCIIVIYININVLHYYLNKAPIYGNLQSYTLKQRRKVDIRQNGKLRREVHQRFTILALSSLLIIYQQRLQLASSSERYTGSRKKYAYSSGKRSQGWISFQAIMVIPQLTANGFTNIHSYSLWTSFKSFRVHFRDIYTQC